MFVGVMRESAPHMFAKILRAIENKVSFLHAIESTYMENISSIWLRFLSYDNQSLRSSGLPPVAAEVKR